MNTLPPPPDPLLQPVRDPRARDLVLDYADMHALVADLVLPGDVSLLRPPSPAGAIATVDGAQPDGGLALLWEGLLRAPFPDGFRGVDFDGVDLVLLDADVAGLVQRELKDGLDDSGIASLWGCIADLDKIVPLINEEYCAAYFTNLVTMAQVAAAPYVPTAT